MQELELSICIPTYRRVDILKETLPHLLQYKSSNIEIVISDNCSNDGTGDFVSELDDARISYYCNEENKGSVYNILKSLQRAKGRFALLISDEDLVYVENIEKLLDLIRSNYDAGLILPSVEGDNLEDFYKRKNKRSKAGYAAVKEVQFCSYLSGFVYRPDLVRRYWNETEFNAFGGYGWLMVAVRIADKYDVVSSDIFITRMAYHGYQDEKSYKYLAREQSPFGPKARMDQACKYVDALKETDMSESQRCMLMYNWIEQYAMSGTVGYLSGLANRQGRYELKYELERDSRDYYQYRKRLKNELVSYAQEKKFINSYDERAFFRLYKFRWTKDKLIGLINEYRSHKLFATISRIYRDNS